MGKLFLAFIFISGFASINLNRNPNAIDVPFELEINNLNHKGWETFDNIIDEKYIVGLGEATHYNDGFNRARGQFIKRLVDSKGFRLVLIETQDTAVAQLRSYLDKGECQPLSQHNFPEIFEGWRSVVVGEFFQWACEFNREHPDDQILLYGFDIQGMVLEGAKTVHQFMHRQKIVPTLSTKIRDYDSKISNCLFGGVPAEKSYKIFFEQKKAMSVGRNIMLNAEKRTLDEFNQCQLALSILDEVIEEHGASAGATEALIRSAAYFKYENLSEYEKILYQGEQPDDSKKAGMLRDLGMAEVSKSFIREMKRKTIIWAHSGHLNKNSLKNPENNVWLHVGEKILGQHIFEEHGSDYFVINITAYQIGTRCSKRYSYCKDDIPSYFSHRGLFWENKIKAEIPWQEAFIPTSSSIFLETGQHYNCYGFAGECSIPREHGDAFFYMAEAEHQKFLNE